MSNPGVRWLILRETLECSLPYKVGSPISEWYADRMVSRSNGKPIEWYCRIVLSEDIPLESTSCY